MSFSETVQEEWIFTHFSQPGWAVDVGANDGVLFSNTMLAERCGWEVLCVEANPEYEIPLLINRKRVEMCAVSSVPGERKFYVNRIFPASGSALIRNGDSYDEITVMAQTLDHLLEKHQFPQLDLLSIDVEHTELDVLGSLDFGRWQPKMVIVESIDDRISGHEEAAKTEQGLCDFLAPYRYRKMGRADHDLLFLKEAKDGQAEPI